MPNLDPPPVDIDSLKVQLDIVKKDACIKVYPLGVLEAWTGTWKSFYGSVSDPSMISVYTEVQKYYQEQYSVKGIGSLFETMLRTGFDGLKVEGSTVTYLDDKGVAQGSVTYVSRGTQPSGMKKNGKKIGRAHV